MASNNLSLIENHTPPERERVCRLYESLWGVEGPVQVSDLYEQREMRVKTDEVLTPISTKEIWIKIKQIDNSSAAGPDGITKGDLRRGVEVALAALYNLLLLKGYYPKESRSNCTTLISKAGKDTRDVRNWRHITISSILSRIFSAMLDRRLRTKVGQDQRQKGFTEENGCYVNIQILSEILAKAKREGGVINITDVQKAFDTVPHAAIGPALVRKGIPPAVARYITNIYSDCTTKIRTADGDVEIGIRRGVKQGDPLSSLIFNLCIEPEIVRIQSETEGLPINGSNVAALAFADDMMLVGKDTGGANAQVRLLAEYLSRLGMSLVVESEVRGVSDRTEE